MISLTGLETSQRRDVPERVLTLLKAAALALCFGLSLLAGPIASWDKVQYVFLALGGLAVVAFSLYRLEWGILVLILSTLVLRFSLSTGTSTPLVGSLLLTALLTGLWLIRMFLEDGRLHWLPSPVNLPLVGFMVVCVLSYIWSDLWRDPLVYLWGNFALVRVGALAAMVLSPAALLLIANRFRDERLLKILVGIFVVTGAVGLIAAWVGVNLPLVNLRGLFPMWLTGLTLSQALFNRQLKEGYRWALGLLGGAWLAYKFAFAGNVAWLSGWLPALVALTVIAFLRSRWLFLTLIVAGLLLTAVNWDYLDNAIVVQSQQEGDFGRLNAWEVNWRVTKDHLFLGTGPAGYAAYYMSLFPQDAMATHNNYVDIVAETGLVGLGFFVWFLVAMGVTGRQAWRRVPRGGFLQALAAACIGGYAGTLVAMSLGDWFLPFAYTQTIAGFDYTVWGWLFMGVLVGLSHYGGRLAADDRGALG